MISFGWPGFWWASAAGAGAYGVSNEDMVTYASVVDFGLWVVSLWVFPDLGCSCRELTRCGALVLWSTVAGAPMLSSADVWMS